MFAHLRYRSARVETRSPAGELAERVLMLNDEHSVQYRETVLSVIATLSRKWRDDPAGLECPHGAWSARAPGNLVYVGDAAGHLIC
jgi:hypothetical protein